jgi:acyl carrier protein
VTLATDPAGGQRAEIERRLRAFIVTELVEEPYDGADPLADQVVDSLAIEQLVEYIHESYGVELEDEEMIEENFESLARLAGLVSEKRKTSR